MPTGKVSRSVYKDAKSVIFGFFGTFNEGKKHTEHREEPDERGIHRMIPVEVFDVPYYAFCIHTNGKEVATGMFTSRLPCLNHFDKYYDRNKERFFNAVDCSKNNYCSHCR